MVSVRIENAIIDAFMALVGESSLDGASLPMVAARADVSLSTLRSAFSGRMGILAAFSARMDQAVLAALDVAMAEEAARERLFDVLFARLEQLAPYRMAIASLLATARRDPVIALHINNIACHSMAWMMAGAGISHTGKAAAVRAQGLALIWGRVLKTWLADDDPGLARTMAMLDRSLRRGERVAMRLARLENLADRLCGNRRGPHAAEEMGRAAAGGG